MMSIKLVLDSISIQDITKNTAVPEEIVMNRVKYAKDKYKTVEGFYNHCKKVLKISNKDSFLDIYYHTDKGEQNYENGLRKHEKEN